MWRLELLKIGLRKQLENGSTIHLFKDPWLPRPVSFKVIAYENPSDMSLVKDFKTPSFHWKINQLQDCLCSDDVQLISKIPVSPTVPDKWI